MADIRKTVGDLDTWGAFDGTEVMEVFPESEGKSYKKKVGTAADRDVGTGNDDLPDTSQLNVRLGTTGNLGTAAIADIGVGPSEIRINSNAMPSRTESGNYTAQTGDYIINCTASNAEITIPDDFPIGYRLLIRKLSAYDITNTDKIDIVFSGGDVCTPEQLASIEIYGNGGNWLIEKVTATRWEIVAGWDGGQNAANKWTRYADGDQICSNPDEEMGSILAFGDGSASDPYRTATNDDIFFALPFRFNTGADGYTLSVTSRRGTNTGARTAATAIIAGRASDRPRNIQVIRTTNLSDNDNFQVSVIATGRWYSGL